MLQKKSKQKKSKRAEEIVNKNKNNPASKRDLDLLPKRIINKMGITPNSNHK
jgi:hypothetical protein